MLLVVKRHGAATAAQINVAGGVEITKQQTLSDGILVEFGAAEPSDMRQQTCHFRTRNLENPEPGIAENVNAAGLRIIADDAFAGVQRLGVAALRLIRPTGLAQHDTQAVVAIAQIRRRAHIVARRRGDVADIDRTDPL
jgi:hypothetical protein